MDAQRQNTRIFFSVWMAMIWGVVLGVSTVTQAVAHDALVPHRRLTSAPILQHAIEVRLPGPASVYGRQVGIVIRCPDGKTVIYLAKDDLLRYPSIGRRVHVGDRVINYVHWNRDGTQFILGSPSGDGGPGWAWVIDSRQFVVVRKLPGDIAAAWFEGSRVAYVQVTGHGPVCIRGRSRQQLPRSIVVSAATDDGKFLLARTHIHKVQADLVIFQSTKTGIRPFATVEKQVDLPDEPIELISSDHAQHFMVTACGNTSQITYLCDAVYIGREGGHPIYPGAKFKTRFGLYFDLNSYWSPTGFCGICREIDDQAANGPVDTFYHYRWNGSRVFIHKLSVPVIAYSMNAKGQEAALIERRGQVYLHIGPL